MDGGLLQELATPITICGWHAVDMRVSAYDEF